MRKRAEERRKWPRLAVALPVFVRGVDEQGREFLEFTSALNISAGGALLAIRRYLPRSTRIVLEFPSAPLPRLKTGPRYIRSLRARLVRVTHSDRCHLCGLRFSRPLSS